ncbi:MAG TPA: SgcJ/EcaC family oxidoreductase, partial [Pseudorhizobium sp.]|nr:SgcJ/EcaC family oxidoreductase [Pseudorhizobium sp.]
MNGKASVPSRVFFVHRSHATKQKPVSTPTRATERGTSWSDADRIRDVDAIKLVVAAIEETQRNRNADRFMQLLSPDAVWVTAFGKRLTGWDEINGFTQKVLPSALGDQFATCEVVHITFLGDGAAAVNVHQRPVDKQGAPIKSEAEGRPLYIMTREAGKWTIAIGQGTKLQPESIDAQSK